MQIPLRINPLYRSIFFEILRPSIYNYSPYDAYSLSTIPFHPHSQRVTTEQLNWIEILLRRIKKPLIQYIYTYIRTVYVYI